MVERAPNLSILLIDNFDSFTYNLVQALGSLGCDRIQVRRNNAVTVDEIREEPLTHLIISPGPGGPAEAGISRSAIRELAGVVPILGVCLGHQCMAEVFGGRVVQASRIMHGKTSMIYHKGDGLFRGLPMPFAAARYHSLLVEYESLPEEFAATAWTQEGELMAMRHKTLSLDGVQFHPESFMTESGRRILSNFLVHSVCAEAGASKHRMGFDC